MVDSKALKAKIDDSGLKLKYIAEQLGLSDYGFRLKLNGKHDFLTKEVAILCELLKITSLKEKELIFFAKRVE